MALSKISNDMFTTISRPRAGPIIYNGDMQVSQRATSTTGVGNGDNGYPTIDRWRFSENGSISAEWTHSQATDVPTGEGFTKSLKLDCTTADGSPGSGDAVYVQQRFEGQDLQGLKKGTSNAETLTLAFWVKSTKTGTFICELIDVDNSRHISKSYTVSSSDTWEKKIVTFAGDTTGAFGNDSGESLNVIWYLVAGTNLTEGTLATSWAAYNDANGAVGQVNIADSTSNDWLLTGVQLEVGEFNSSTLPPFQHESYGDNLKRCQRYAYEVISNESSAGNAPIGTAGIMYSSSQMMFNIPFPVPMRTNPSLTCSSASNNYSFLRNSAADTFDDFVIDKANSNLAEVKNSTDISGTAGHGGTVRTNASSLSVLFTAEL